MDTQIAYCSACDRDVLIQITGAEGHDAQAPMPDAEIICLEVGQRCSGPRICPVAGISQTAMRVRRVRAGLRTVLQPLVMAECRECRRVTEHVLADADFATCPECGTTTGTEQLTLALGRDG